MNTKIRLFACAVALAVTAGARLHADDPAPPLSTGKILILDNDRTLEGDIERHADQYRVRRAVGEVWIPAEHVMHLCRTKDEAYAFMRRQANLRDPDEHLRLAHWCQLHGLKGHALEEARETVALRPDHSPSRRLLQSLERAGQSERAPIAGRQTEDGETAVSAPNIDADSLSLFVTKVQPTLMNACAACHANGKGGSFKLARVYERGLVNRRTTYQNLVSVLAQVNEEHFQLSPLLLKAAAVHGEMAQPAIKNRDVTAYRTLEDWVRMTAESKQMARGQTVTPTVPLPATETQQANQPLATRVEQIGAAATSAENAPTGIRPVSAEQAATPKRGADANPSIAAPAANEPADPYDPAIFNRQTHPEKK
jgi:hypothetical protein